jgi:hypothetical protein
MFESVPAGWSTTTRGRHEYDKPSVRIERLEEALTIISRCGREETTFSGSTTRSTIALKIDMLSARRYRSAEGGGKLWAVADVTLTVGINRRPGGRITAATALDITAESIRLKIDGCGGGVGGGRDPTQSNSMRWFS